MGKPRKIIRIPKTDEQLLSYYGRSCPPFTFDEQVRYNKLTAHLKAAHVNFKKKTVEDETPIW